MEVEILSKETIKPSSSTRPQRPTTYNLSVLDQVAPQFYVPIILFYQNTSSITPNHHLKKSLSETLGVFYPLAGRIRDDWSCVDCNDDGATYIEAKVAGDMASVALAQQTTEGLQELLPLNPHGNFPDKLSSLVLLAVQVNYFDCGGIAIGVCIWHEIADASTLASFVQIWAEISRARCQLGATAAAEDVVFDNTSIFVPQDMTSPLAPRATKKGTPVTDSLTMKKLVFHASDIASLQKQAAATGYDDLDRPITRFEAVTNLLWVALMSMESSSDDSSVHLLIAVDLRKRLNPQLPQRAIGNICESVLAFGPDSCCRSSSDINGLVKRIRDSTKVLTDEHIRQFHRDGGLFKFLYEVSKKKPPGEVENKTMVFSVSSWCRFPFYKADFGWGKPVWVCPALRLWNGCVLMDTRDGEGIEAWVGMSKEDMEKFLQIPEIGAHAYFISPTTTI